MQMPASQLPVFRNQSQVLLRKEPLLCVRYRYDETRGVRLKTVEIIVEEKTWQPPFSFKNGDIAPITVAFEETELRAKLQKLRARWDPNEKVWLVPYRLIRGTDLETRIPDSYIGKPYINELERLGLKQSREFLTKSHPLKPKRAGYGLLCHRELRLAR